MKTASRFVLQALLALTCLLSAAAAHAQAPCPQQPTVPLSSDWRTIDILILGDGYTQAECAQFFSEVQALQADLVRGQAGPFAEYDPYIRVTGYFEASNASGASHRMCTDTAAFGPPNGTPEPLSANGTRNYFIDTKYSISYCANGKTERTLAPLRPDATGARTVVDFAWLEAQGDRIMPGADAVMVVVNEARWGGTANKVGDRIATVPRGPLHNREHILQHELGHALLNVGDEYISLASPLPGATNCDCDDTSADRSKWCPPNISSFATPADRVKWRAWYGDTNGPATVTNPPTHRGAINPGCYRPGSTCKMREPQDFCVVCREEGIENMWAHSRFIGRLSPAPSTVNGIINQGTVFEVEQTAPGDMLRYKWTINGSVTTSDPGAPNRLTYIPGSAGIHTIHVDVDDPTPSVKEQPNREVEIFDWRMSVPASVQLATNGTAEVKQQIAVNVPAGTTSLILEYAVASNEPGGRVGDPWSIVVGFEGSSSALTTPGGRVLDPTGVPTTRKKLEFKASSSARTAILAITVQNGEEADFADTTVTAALHVNSNCGNNCDPCQMDPPGPGCPIPITITAARVKKFTDYDHDAWYKYDVNPDDESYFALPQGEELTHDRFLQLKVDTVSIFKSLRAVATVLDANGNEIQPGGDYVLGSIGTSPFMHDKSGYMRLMVTPNALGQYIPDHLKSHVIQYRLRTIVTLHDNRVGETETIVRVVNPDDRPLAPLHALYKAPMPRERHYNEYPDTQYASAATYKWLTQYWQDATRFPQSGKTWGQIAGEHALDFSGTSPWGTHVEARLGTPSADVAAAAFDNAASRETLITQLVTVRDRVYQLVSNDNMVSQVRMPSGFACPANSNKCKHSLGNGWFQELILTGRTTDLKNRVLDLTGDSRIGSRWIINENRLAFNGFGETDYELVMDRCRLGETPGPCNTGRCIGCRNLRIVSQPAGASILPGGSANMGVVAEGPDLKYRWYAGVAGDFSQSTPVSGGTTREIEVRPAATTTYWVYVWNDTGSEKSNGATVDVCTPASIPVPPFSPVIEYADGAGATLSVTGAGTAPLSYRWLDASGNVVGTSASVFITTKQTATYTAEVTNRCGTARATATITVRPCIPPAFTYQSTPNVNLNPTQSTTLAVTADGSPNLRYRWYANGSDTGITTPSYFITPSATTDYHVIVSNDCGQVQSHNFHVIVCLPPSFTAQPQPKNIVRGNSTTLNVSIAGSEPRAVIWHTASGTPSGGGVEITVSPTVTTTYIARVSNACGAVDSNPVTVTVCNPPVVDIQPQPATISRGDSKELTVTASGDATLTYQWYRNGALIPGATQAAHTASPTETSDYRVVVTNGCSTTSSAIVTITVICNLPVIDEQPKSVLVLEGDLATLSVKAGGSTPFSYQWYQGATLLVGETGPSLIFNAETTASYSVKVTNPCGTVTSNTATVSVTARCLRALISVQPESKSIVAGQSHLLSVTHGGTSPFEYQWFADGVLIPGATHSSYNASPTVTTSYHVTITNCFVTTSQQAVVTVESCQPVAIDSQPASVVIQSGEETTLTVVASGRAPLTYQWYANGVAITNAKSDSYKASPASTTTYRVVVSNVCGSVTSNLVTVTVGVCEPAAITDQPDSVGIDSGQQVTLRVTANGSDLRYQWYANGAEVTGAVTDAYTISPTATTSYHVVVSNGCSSVTSSTAVISVGCAAPVMGLQPKSVTIEPGTTVELKTTSSGLQPFTWKWYANGVAVPFSNGSSLEVSPSTTTSYYVVVTNACGSVTSSTAVVTVQTCIEARITDEPDDVTIAPNGTTTLSVQTTGSQPRTIEWRNAAGTVIGTSASVSVTAASTTTFSVRVSNACGSDVDTVTVTVVDCPPPVITFQPGSFTTTEWAQSLFLEVVATSATPLSYQWYADGVAIPGKTTRAVDVGPATVTKSYYVKVTNACGTVQSNTATITVNPCTKAHITTQPKDVTIVDGESATISAVAAGTGPIRYTMVNQDMTDAGSSTNGVFSVKPPIQAPGVWGYMIIASNDCATVFSEWANVTVLSACTPPTITSSPQSVTIAPNGNATLTVSASGSTPFTVKWFNAATGAQVGTGTSFTVSPSSTTSYYARVSNSCGEKQSTTATVTVSDPCTPPVVTSPATDVAMLVRYGNTRTLNVTATGSNLQYQWFISVPLDFPYEELDGETGPSLTVSPDEPTRYRVRVTNSCGQVLSPSFKVVPWDGIGDPPDPEHDI